MKHLLVIVGFGVLLLFALFPTVQGKRVSSERTTTPVIKEKVQPAKSIPAAVAPPSKPASEPSIAPQEQTAVNASAPAADYTIPWHSMNAGGVPISDPGYSINGSLGQSVIGFVTSAGNEGGVGYWYGVCSCPFQGDFDEDGFLTALDLSALIDILFAGQPDVQDAECPSPRADFDCDGFSTALDLSRIIDHLFAGGDGPCDPCAR